MNISKKIVLLASNLAVSNFQSDDKKNPVMVPWLKADKDWLKANKDITDKYKGLYRGINPHLILAILDGDQAAWRKLAESAISQAEPKLAPQLQPTNQSLPTSPAEPTYVTFSGGIRSDNAVSRSIAMALAAVDPHAQFYLFPGGVRWQSAEELGFLLPPAPEFAVASPLPAAPTGLDDSVDTPGNTPHANPPTAGDGADALTNIAEQIAQRRRLTNK